MTDEDAAATTESQAEPHEEEQSEEQKDLAKLKEAISVDKASVGALRLKLTVTVPQEAVDERRSDEYTELKREAMIPGFRKGHAPMRLVEKRFAGDVGEQLKSRLISRGYTAAVEMEALKPLGDPLFWVTVEEERSSDGGAPRKVQVERLLPFDQALDNIKMPREGALSFSCEVELHPEFELPALDKIPVNRPKLSITDEDVQTEVDRLRMLRGTYHPVEQGPIQADDLLYADMTCTVDGATLAQEENFEIAARDVRFLGIPLTGFGEAATGRKTGDTVTLSAAVPEDFDDGEIRGKTAEFSFVIREVKRLALPELTEEFVVTLGFDSVEELRSTLRSSLEGRLDAAVQEAMRTQAASHLLERTMLEIPEGLSQRQTERAVSRRMIELYQAGTPQAEIEKAADELRAKAHDQTIRDLKLFFILEKIAEERNIGVSEETLNSAIAEIARRTNKRFDRVRDELSKGEGLVVLYHKLRDQKVLDSLLEEAVITDTEPPKKPSAAKPKAGTHASPKTTASKKPPAASSTKKPAASKPSAAKARSKKPPAKKSAKPSR